MKVLNMKHVPCNLHDGAICTLYHSVLLRFVRGGCLILNVMVLQKPLKCLGNEFQSLGLGLWNSKLASSSLSQARSLTLLKKPPNQQRQFLAKLETQKKNNCSSSQYIVGFYIYIVFVVQIAIPFEQNVLPTIPLKLGNLFILMVGKEVVHE